MDKKWIEYRDRIIFDSDANSFESECEKVRRELAGSDGRLLSELTIDLMSYLPRWITGNENGALDAAVKKQAAENAALLSGGQDAPGKIKAEAAAIQKSNLVKMSRLADKGAINNRWGNDNGLGLMNAMRRGAALVTTNPPIINMARKAAPEFYDKVRDSINAEHKNDRAETRISYLTLNVVLNNCRALRGIYEKTGHQLGYVNYQVDPNNYKDAQKMADEVFFVYGKAQDALGYKPNIVFKVPGTQASLDAVRTVTKSGIGVNITVNFSVSQSLAFADIIEQGSAEKSYVTVMAGRLDDPVAAELEKSGTSGAAEISRNASCAVTRKVYRELLENGLAKTEILVASLRGPWNFDASITDNSASRIVISSFPDKWEEYDSRPRDIVSHINDRIPAEIMDTLNKSDIFRKAYEKGLLAPDGFDSYVPVVQTLGSFIDVYQELKDYMG